jgi:hypothetical protein
VVEPSLPALMLALGPPISTPMNSRVRVLRELVSESLYVIDEAAVAEAIVVRATYNITERKS